jgi:hypothetical protein
MPIFENLFPLSAHQFVFCAGTTQHKDTRHLVSTLLQVKDYPLFAVLAPRSSSKERSPQLLAVLRLTTDEVKPERMFEFLQR